MPVRIYICSKCTKTKKKLFKTHEEENSFVSPMCPECNVLMKRKVATVSDAIVKEQADSYRNKQVKKDLNSIMKRRSKEHHVKHELPDLIAKYGTKYAREQGWLKEDGTPKKMEDYE